MNKYQRLLDIANAIVYLPANTDHDCIFRVINAESPDPFIVDMKEFKVGAKGRSVLAASCILMMIRAIKYRGPDWMVSLLRNKYQHHYDQVATIELLKFLGSMVKGPMDIINYKDPTIITTGGPMLDVESPFYKIDLWTAERLQEWIIVQLTM